MQVLHQCTLIEFRYSRLCCSYTSEWHTAASFFNSLKRHCVYLEARLHKKICILFFYVMMVHLLCVTFIVHSIDTQTLNVQSSFVIEGNPQVSSVCLQRIYKMRKALWLKNITVCTQEVSPIHILNGVASVKSWGSLAHALIFCSYMIWHQSE